ncbi:MAG: TraK family protein [bacterium]|nr:TraK family protein [bacterium]
MAYNGRVEILACMIDIERLLNEGHTYKSMYDILFSKKKISMTYYHFCALLKKYNLKKIDTSSALSKKYKEGLEKKLKSLPKEELNRIQNINISNLIPVRDAFIKDKINSLSIYHSNEYEKGNQLAHGDKTDVDDEFGIIRKPEDEVF